MAEPRLPHPPPANDPPQLRSTRAVAVEFGFKNPRAVADWCRRRGIPYTRDGGFNWVDRNLVVAAMARGRTVVVVVPPPASPSVANWVDNALGGGNRG